MSKDGAVNCKQAIEIWKANVALWDDKKAHFTKLGEDDPSWKERPEYKTFSQNLNPYTTAAGYEENPYDGKDAGSSTVVKLYAMMPPMKKMSNDLNGLTNCEYLSLSCNSIGVINIPLSLRNLKILSLGRNTLKVVKSLDELGPTLEQLWLSYNSIEKLTGMEKLRKLRVLFLANNNIKSFDELTRLETNVNLEELLLTGNPIYKSGDTMENIRIEVIKRLPRIKKLDGVMILDEERAAAGVL